MGVKNTFIASSGQLGANVVNNAALGTDLALGCSIPLLFGWPQAVTGTWARSFDALQMHGNYIQNSTHNIGDKISMKTWLGKGTYDLNYLGMTGADAPIVTITIDGTTISTQDTYTAGTVYNWIAGDSITVTTSGLKTFQFEITSKNAASSNYYFKITAMFIIRKT